LKHLHSGGQIVELTTHQAEIGCNVFLEHTNGVHSRYRFYLAKTDPCPSPSICETVAVRPEFEVDAGLTMCDLWEGFYNKEKVLKQAERRKSMQRHTGVKHSVCKAFGCCDVPEDSTLFRAACGFVEGSQEQCHQCDDEEGGLVATRCSEKDKKKLLTQMVTYMYNGEVAHDLEQMVLRKKRFSTVKLARVSDMSSSFNPSALGQ
jgi:hypothetical protein